jgi:hypothetical protein
MANHHFLYIFFAMDQACLDLSNESYVISEIISLTTDDPIPMPDATKEKNSKGKKTSKFHGNLRTLWP